jgi:hypothetical protein
MTRTINSKQEFIRLSLADRLGNRFRQWNTIEEAEQALPNGGVYVRGPMAGWKFMIPWVSTVDLRATMRALAQKTSIESVSYVEILPFGTPRLLNFYVVRDPGFLALEWGDSDQLSVRDDIERPECQRHYGLEAREIMRSRIPPDDYWMIEEIWDEYPDSVIEGAVFSRTVGVQQRQTVIFEVRNY